jgi:hypothetical protein
VRFGPEIHIAEASSDQANVVTFGWKLIERHLRCMDCGISTGVYWLPCGRFFARVESP